MASLENLKKTGWYLSDEGLALISKENKLKDISSIIKNALDVDLKDIGSPVLLKDLENGIPGPIVVQIQKLRNVSAPKSNESSGAAPRLLKLVLTDGHTTCQAIEYDSIQALSLAKTCPGTKIRLQNVQSAGSYLLLTNATVTVLGGNVPALVERWQLAKSLQKHSRETVEGGPPPWVPFGQRIITQAETDRNFKSLSAAKDKDVTNSEFNAQRQDAIAEASQGAVRKVFGGGVKPLPSRDSQYSKNIRQEIDNKKQSSAVNNKNINEESRNGSSKSTRSSDRRKGREKEDSEMQKPTSRISLFDFFENKLPTSEVEKIEEQINKSRNQNTVKPTYAQKYDASLRYKGNENRNKKDSSYNNKDKRPFDPQKMRDKQYNHLSNSNNPNGRNYQNQNDRNTRYNNVPEKAPRFQKLQNNMPRENNSNDKMQNTFQNYNNDNRSFELTNYVSSYDNKNQIDSLIEKTDSMSMQSNYTASNRYDQNRFYNQNKTTFVPREQNRYGNTNVPKDPQYTRNNQMKDRFNNKNDSYKPREQIGMSSSYLPMEPVTQNNTFLPKVPFDLNDSYSSGDNFTADKFQNSACTEWKWNVGDRCMAKYWEDNRYYDASVTGVTDRTCVVCFKDYGNFEEVLKADCIPITDKPISNFPSAGAGNFNNNANKFTGSLVFRRGGNGPYQKNPMRSNMVNGQNFKNQ